MIFINLKPWVWLRYIDDIFFVWTHGEDKLHDFLSRLNEVHPKLKFTYEYSTEQINFLDVIVKKEKDEFVTDLYCQATDCHQYLHMTLVIQIIRKNQVFIVKDSE